MAKIERTVEPWTNKEGQVIQPETRSLHLRDAPGICIFALEPTSVCERTPDIREFVCK